ncbi:hypothetical protein [Pseudomonas oryzihabitans]|uniref:hypothetical protein n=1 Tax=Pseudomonas oryzihabitans TaxID=47885 RepID=UPI00286AACAD|nr:hypothetical protein [Pseudomonas psychrotolerans]
MPGAPLHHWQSGEALVIAGILDLQRQVAILQVLAEGFATRHRHGTTAHGGSAVHLLVIEKADHGEGHVEQLGAQHGEILEDAVRGTIDQGKVTQQRKTLAFVGCSEWRRLHGRRSDTQ